MSGELECAVLGALVFRPSLLESCDLRASDFLPGRNRQAFSIITEVWQEGRPAEIDTVLLAERIGGDCPHAFVTGLLGGSIKLEPERFCDRVAELRKRSLTAKIESTIERQAKSGELDLAVIRPDLDEYDSLEERSLDLTKVLITGAEMQALDITMECTIDKLVPCRSLVLLHGPGGLAKTWLALCMSKAVSMGTPFIGLPTKQRFVIYVDFENPWPMLIDRVRKLDIRDVRFWHLSADIRPPKLDSPDWTMYKRLPCGSFLIFDTARSSFDGDENSSQDVGLVMNRLKEIRELGNDVLLLHHTPRRNERASKGSTAWEDLADHVLAFYKVKKETLEDTDEEVDFDPRALLSLGTGRKTRYEPFRMYLTLDPEAGGFTAEEDPRVGDIDAIANYIAGEGSGKNQGEIISWAKEAGIGPKMRSSFIALLNRGEGKRWHSHKGFRGARYYEPPT